MDRKCKLASFSAVIFLLFPITGLTNNISTYDALIEARKCYSNNNELNCKFELGNSFSLEILGVGEANSVAPLLKSDIEGVYYARIYPKISCVEVTESLLNTGFISLKNGKVYRDEVSCGKHR